ncbi:MAG: hypothetical protein HYT27_01820 [Parcubacteria group bacterium]|nr:hypothetical protein [Parcubacteria group bacterium]
MRLLQLLLLVLLFGGQPFTALSHEMHKQQDSTQPKAVWTHSMRPLEQYGLTFSPDSSRFEVLCLEHEKITPRRSGSPVCNAHDKEGVMHVSISAENQACYQLDAGAPSLCEAEKELIAWSARYAPGDIVWQVKRAKAFLARVMHLAEGAFIGEHLHARDKNFLAHSVILPSACSVPDTTVVHYDIVTAGTVSGSTVSHTIHTLQGFFSVEVPYMVEIRRQQVEVVRELYFSISVFNGGVSHEFGKEACEIIKNLASQARRN